MKKMIFSQQNAVIDRFRMVMLLAVSILFFLSSPVHALVIDLNQEFDGNSSGTTSYGTVTVTQNGNDLDFIITANTANLGGGDIHEFYFNLTSPPDPVTGLAVTVGNWLSASSKFTILGPNPSISGGAGASFDWGVSFGNGGGTSGNGVLTTATFTLSADQTLLVDDLLEWTATNNTPDVYMAVHFQDTDIFNADSEMVGGGAHAPVPAPIYLLGTGLIGLVGFRGRRRITS